MCLSPAATRVRERRGAVVARLPLDPEPRAKEEGPGTRGLLPVGAQRAVPLPWVLQEQQETGRGNRRLRVFEGRECFVLIISSPPPSTLPSSPPAPSQRMRLPLLPLLLL